MKRILAILLSFFLNAGQAQNMPVDSSHLLLRSFTTGATDAVMDNMENLYLITANGQIRKFSAAGDSLAVYNQVRNYGSHLSLDVSNPLRPLLFYRDFSTVLLLDRFLATRATLDLRRSNILQPSAIGVSYDNHIWVFDSYDNRLKKIDEQGNILMETPDFRNFLSGNWTPRRIINDNGLVYLADPENGILVFDNYGTYRRKLQLTGWNSMAVRGNYLIASMPGGISVYNSVTHDQKSFPYPPGPDQVFSLSVNGRMLGISPGMVNVYQLRF